VRLWGWCEGVGGGVGVVFVSSKFIENPRAPSPIADAIFPLVAVLFWNRKDAPTWQLVDLR
jgi:hypothetical protein